MKLPSLLAILALITTGNGAVIQNDAMIVTPTTAPPNVPAFYLFYPHQFILTQSAPPGNGLFLLEVAFETSTKFTFRYSGIAEAYSLFLTSPGVEFGADFVNTSSSFVNNWNSPGSGTLTLGFGQSAYIGYWDNRHGPGLTATNDDLFGWARVRNQSGSLTVIDSATAIGGGIVIGTLQQVPEPSSIMIVLLTAGVTLFRRRRFLDSERNG
jgi:hypothetical protein